MTTEEPSLGQCEHCCGRYLPLAGFRRQSKTRIVDEENNIIDCIYEWNYCSEECRDAHIKQTEAWTPDKQRASLSIIDDAARDDWKKRHNLS